MPRQWWEQMMPPSSEPSFCVGSTTTGRASTSSAKSKCPECLKPSSKSRIRKPFCSARCRDKKILENQNGLERKLVEACAQEGELILNEGRLCRVTKVVRCFNTDPKNKPKNPPTWTVWWLACGEEIGYPKAVAAPSSTCLGCLAFDGVPRRHAP